MNYLDMTIQQIKAKHAKAPVKPQLAMAIRFTNDQTASEFLQKASCLFPHDCSAKCEGQYLVIEGVKEALSSFKNGVMNDFLSIGAQVQDQDATFDPHWLINKKDLYPLGITAVSQGDNKKSAIENANELFGSLEDRDIFENVEEIEAVKGYTADLWQQEFIPYLVQNWDCSEQQATQTVQTVLNYCRGHFNQPLRGQYDRLSQLKHAIYVENRRSYMKQFKSDIIIIEDSCARIQVEKELEQATYGLWDMMVRELIAMLPQQLKPKNYEVAKEAYYEDEWDTKLNLTPFNSVYPRPNDDILYDVNSALAMQNILYSALEQGTNPMRSLVFFLVRDLWEIHHLHQQQFMLSALLSAANDLPNTVMSQDWWRTQYNNAVTYANTAFWGQK